MNILILTGKFGMGHLSAANALREQLGQDGHRAEVVDLFEYAAPELAQAMYWWFNVLVTYGGGFYNIYHDLTVNDSGDSRGDNLLGGLDRLLDEYEPDVVVSTHPICSAAMAKYKEEGPSDIPLVTCVTDVTCHSEWLHPATDCYLVAEESVRQGFIAKGADPDAVVVSGIPVSGRFQPARKGPSQRRELLIMGGGLGLMPRRDSFYQALNGLPGVHTTILTGRAATTSCSSASTAGMRTLRRCPLPPRWTSTWPGPASCCPSRAVSPVLRPLPPGCPSWPGSLF